MGYRDDFYIRENIIGFTGDIGGLPSVYFKKVGSMFVEWGRITQTYPENRKNEGRALVRKNRTYEVKNGTIRGEIHATEYVDGKEHHTSRNEFFPVTSGTREVLADGIRRFPEVRQRHAQAAASGHHTYEELDKLFGIGGTDIPK